MSGPDDVSRLNTERHRMDERDVAPSQSRAMRLPVASPDQSPLPRSSQGAGRYLGGNGLTDPAAALFTPGTPTLEWRLGWIELTNDGPPLVAQVYRKWVTVPWASRSSVLTRSTLALPAGDYRLRVHGVGRLGRTYRFAVNRGETQLHALSLDEGRLLGGSRSLGCGGQEKPEREADPVRDRHRGDRVDAGQGRLDRVDRPDRHPP